MERYSRQINLQEIGEEGQKKLTNAKVLIVGCGGLGVPAAQFLVSSGVGHVTLLDHDVVSISNLHRQNLYGEKDLGKFKAEVLKERLLFNNSSIQIETKIAKFDETIENNWLNQFDIFLEATDNLFSKYLLNDKAVQLNKPIVLAGLTRWNGQVALFNDSLNSPTYRCLYPNPPALDEIPTCEEEGILPSLSGIVGVTMAHFTLLHLLKQSASISSKLFLFDGLSFVWNNLKIKRSFDYGNVLLYPEKVKFCQLKDSGKLFLLDVREKNEMDRTKSDLNIPLSEIPQRYLELPKDEPISIFCVTGKRAKRVADFLNTKGYTCQVIEKPIELYK